MIFRIFIIIFLVFCLFTADSFAGVAKVEGVQVRKKDGSIFVSADLAGAVTSQFGHEISNGMEKELFYYIVLKRKQRNWMDVEVAEITIKYSIKYDLLKKQFYVEVSKNGKNNGSFLFKDFDSAKQMISKVTDIKIFDVARLNKRYRYYVSVKAVMQKKLPFYFDYLFFFIPMLEIDTPWKDSSRLKYIKPDQ